MVLERVVGSANLTSTYNARIKYYPSASGELRQASVMVCNKQIFTPGCELCHPILTDSEKIKEYLRAEEIKKGWEKAREEAETENASIASWERFEKTQQEKRGASELRSRKRAISAIFDLINSNEELTYFCTWTVDNSKLDRYDYSKIIKPLSQWLNNRVKRNGLRYVIVPELHRDGAVHFHGVINNTVKMVDSGTVLRPEGGKPVKLATAQKQGYNLKDCRAVYNMPDWCFGFTTAIQTTGERGALARYVSKYITKSLSKVGGRWYLSGGDLRRPVYKYLNLDFDAVPDNYAFEIPGTAVKFRTVYA